MPDAAGVALASRAKQESRPSRTSWVDRLRSRREAEHEVGQLSRRTRPAALRGTRVAWLGDRLRLMWLPREGRVCYPTREAKRGLQCGITLVGALLVVSLRQASWYDPSPPRR